MNRVIATIEKADYNSFDVRDYVVLSWDGKEFKTRFEPDHFLEMFNLASIETEHGKQWIPISNCTCGEFGCGGNYTEYQEHNGVIRLNGLIQPFDLEDLPDDQYEQAVQAFYLELTVENFNAIRSTVQTWVS